MTPKQLNYLLTGALILLIGLGVGLTFYATSFLKTKSNNIVSHKLDAAALEEQKKLALQAKSDLNRYANTKESVEKIIPKNKDQARAIAELIQIAKDVGATINNFTFPTSDLGAAPAPKPVATTDDTTQTTNSDTAQSDAPAAAAPKTSSISQAKPVEGLPGILGIDVIVSQIDSIGGPVGGGMSYPQLIDLLRAVEKNRRTMQVKSIQIQPTRTSTNAATTYTLTLNLTIFVKP